MNLCVLGVEINLSAPPERGSLEPGTFLWALPPLEMSKNHLLVDSSRTKSDGLAGQTPPGPSKGAPFAALSKKAEERCLTRADEGAESPEDEPAAKAILAEPRSVKKQFPISKISRTGLLALRGPS